ncbi:hypothetical protein ONE63_008865 [Megalurothrips usitatus]|uniref:CRAL-TRIO domain-containing protein n=1 Tax=Megalurothrips usitatus TaxID=439358 RepID=A0AAV7XL80_9NEOP|nr:hypothetical protein ONE63_008865 [Megalurothrips usitatus]
MAPFWEPLSAAQLEDLHKELGASEDTVRRDVATVRQWMSLQPHLPQLDGTGLDVDHWIRMYLLRCKNSIERTKESLDVLLSGRTTIPEFFHGRDPTAADVLANFDNTLVATMPRLTAEGLRVHYYAYPSADAKNFSVEALFRRVLMMAELLLRDDLPRGELVVVDLANGSASRLRAFSLALALFSKFVRGGLKMYPVRMKRFYLINLPPYLAAVMTLLGQVMKEKLYNRIQIVVSTSDVLNKDLPAECVPQDYGGQGPSLREGNDQWRSYLAENRDWFLAQENVKTDESKRVGPSSFMDEIHLGCPGSFRTLVVEPLSVRSSSMARIGPEIMTPASAEEEQRIYSGVGTDAASARRDALQLRQWLRDQPHLPDLSDEDDPWLERYLVCSKNSMERAKRGLDCYFTVRSEAPTIFADRDSDAAAFKRTFDFTYVVTLPKLTPDLHRVHIYAYAPADQYGGDLADFSFEDLYRRMSMTMDVKFREDLCAGEVCVLDLQHNTTGHLAKFTAVLPFVKQFFACSLAAYPARIHQIHVINAPSYMSTIEGLIKPFLKKKIQDRVIIHPPGLDSFFEHVPKAMLPKDYGGEEASLKELSGKWQEKIDAYRGWFLAQEGVKSDETKRVGDKTALSEEIFGCQGSFRQLTVD